jgi:hypothetical protein
MTVITVKPVQRSYKYDLSKQKELILLSKSDGWNSARVCHEYGIAKSTFSGWKKKIDVSIDYQSGQFTFHSGPKSIGDHLEHLLILLLRLKKLTKKNVPFVPSLTMHSNGFIPFLLLSPSTIPM